MIRKLLFIVFALAMILCILTSCNLGKCKNEDLVIDDAVSATCTTSGLTEGKHCAYCGEVVEQQKTVDPLGHNYREELTTATCTAEGYTKYTCFRCADTYTDLKTPALGHDYVAVVTAPGCLTDGYTTHTCSRCSDSYTDSVISAIGHNHVSAVVAPTCNAEGYTSYTCVCGDVYNESYVPKTSHRFIADKCAQCDMQAPSGSIEPDTEWYDAESSIFTLYTKEELAGLAAIVNAGTDTFANKTVSLGADMDLGWFEWTPIGNKDNAFNGFFNGRGFTVSSLKISARDSYAGLFGNVGSAGTLRDFTVDNASIYAYGTYQYVSVVAGHSGADVAGITVDGYIDAQNCSYVGAISGMNNGSGKSITVCNVSVDINANNYVGGIYGHVSNYITSAERLTSNGNITGNSNVGGIFGRVNEVSSAKKITSYGVISGNEYVGGICGYLGGGSVELCENYEDVSSIGAYAGGLFGYCTSSRTSVKDSVSYGNVSGSYYVGGLIGYMFSGSLYNSRNEGETVTATGFYANGTDKYAYLGGCVGSGSSTITGCTNNANIVYESLGMYVGGIVGGGAVVSDCTNNGDISAAHSKYVGGIFGYSGSNTVFKNCVNSGDISAAYASYVGGIGGNAASGSFSDCTNSGNVSAPHGSYVGGIAGNCCIVNNSALENSGDVVGDEYVGGIFGYNIYSVREYNNVVANVTELSKTGDVSGDVYVGGICGYLLLENDRYDSSYVIYYNAYMTAMNISNGGNVSGNNNVGELFGVFSSDGESTVTSYSVLGKITLNGTELEGDYAVGTNTNLTLGDEPAQDEE